jgi:hypothetical protein
MKRFQTMPLLVGSKEVFDSFPSYKCASPYSYDWFSQKACTILPPKALQNSAACQSEENIFLLLFSFAF